MTKILFIIAFSLSAFSLFGFSSVGVEISGTEENIVQPYMVNLDNNFSDPSVSLNKIYGDDWYAR